MPNTTPRSVRRSIRPHEGDATGNRKPAVPVERRSLTPPARDRKPPPKLNRTTFRTSREMDFFSQKELVTQTGNEVGEWPHVAVKELMDNSLDACEDAGITP